MVKDVLWLHQAFKMAVNEMDSNVNVGYSKELIDIVLNKAVFEWLKELVAKLERNQANIERLSSLVIRTPITSTSTVANDFQSALAPTIEVANGYEFRFSNLDKPYFRYLSAHVEIKKGACTKRGKIKIEQLDDIEKVLIDDNRKPSWRYGEVVGIFGRESDTYTDTTANNVSKSLLIYTEPDTTLGNLYLTYIKRPNQICIGGYNDLNGNPLTRVELDIPQDFYPEIIRYAKMEVENSYGFSNK